MNKKPILAVGSIAIDNIETPNGNKNNVLGGSASYFGLSASLTSNVSLVGVVGNDFPQEGKNLLLSKNININNLQFINGQTFRWGGRYSDDYSERTTLFTKLGVFECFEPEINPKDLSIPLVFLGNIQPDLQLKVIDLMQSPEIIVSDTMNLWIDLFPDRLMSVIERSNILLINHEEAEQITGYKNVEQSAEKFLNMGPDVVVVKMGANGSYLAQKEYCAYIPVYPIKKLIDPTGAGDSFAGGFLGYLSNHEKPNYLNAVIAGTAAASFCVEDFGMGSISKATLNDLNSRIKIIENI